MEKKFKRNLRAKFAVFGLLFLLLLMLPSVHAAGTGNVIAGTSVNAFEQAFGGPGLFVFFHITSCEYQVRKYLCKPIAGC